MRQQLLLVEDQKGIRDLLTTYFQLHGLDVTTAGTASQAIDLCNERIFDLIILDIGLPDVDGLELLSNLKKLTTAPVIVLTGMEAEPALEKEAKDKGANAFVCKNASLESIYDCIEKLLPKKE